MNKHYKVTDNETGTVYNIEELSRLENDTIGYIRATPEQPKRDIWAEAQKLIEYNARNKVAGTEKEFPEPKQQPVNENQIKKFSALLKDAAEY
jgi:hypothetical protein